MPPSPVSCIYQLIQRVSTENNACTDEMKYHHHESLSKHKQKHLVTFLEQLKTSQHVS
jgi:hypothetical protein